MFVNSLGITGPGPVKYTATVLSTQPFWFRALSLLHLARLWAPHLLPRYRIHRSTYINISLAISHIRIHPS
jgi:hypothetical protein